jgi:hypothetical protein
MGRASGRPATHGLFGHIYIRMIMMVPALVATTSFAILLLFSLPSCLHLRTHPILSKGHGSRRLLTDPRSGYCTSTRTFHSMRAPSFSPSSNVSFVLLAFALFFLPNLLPSPTIAAASRPTLVDMGTKQVGLAPGLSSCVPPRGTWWHLHT